MGCDDIDLKSVEARRSKLYGPGRVVAQQKYKAFSTKDSVHDALEKVACYCDDSDWLSDCKRSYVGYSNFSPKHDYHNQQLTNLVLGKDDKKVRYATTSQDFDGHFNRVVKPRSRCIDRTTNIADFNTKGRVVKSGASEYQGSFAVDPSKPRYISRTLGERKRHTDDQRETHFILGENAEKTSSETTHSFPEAPLQSYTNQQLADTSKEIYASRVFRKGDWNDKGNAHAHMSVTKREFILPSLKQDVVSSTKSEETQDKIDYEKTNHRFGSATPTKDSVYCRDFLMGDKHVLPAPRRREGHKPAKLLAEYSFKGISTKEAHYKDHGLQNIIDIGRERRKDLTQNKSRHSENCISLKDGSEDFNKRDRRLSMSSVHFVSPPSHGLQLSHVKGSPPKYNHINSNPTSFNTLSEAQDSYVPSKGWADARKGRLECMDRQQQNKATHFLFGTDANNKVTEQSYQFQPCPQTSDHVRAAGVTLPSSGESGALVLPGNLCSGTCCKMNSSVMKKDYTEPVGKSFSAAQKVLLENKPPGSLPTHFFHMDSSKGPTRTMTMLDFVSPDQMLGPTRLTA